MNAIRLLLTIAVVASSACTDGRARKNAIELARTQITASSRPRLVLSPYPAPIEFETVYLSNEERIRQELQSVTGEVKISGWTTRRIDRDVFLAMYEVQINGEERKYVFEVNLTGRLVRNVSDDSFLSQKYQAAIWGK
jgi:hypothetical protein